MPISDGSPVRSSFLPFHQPLLGEEEEREMIDTLRSGWITTGPKTKAFEKALADYVGAKHCIAVNSCTAALALALEAIGITRGDEVITSPNTFASTANVIIHSGARVVFADVEPDTLNIDPRKLEAAITPRTKAIIPVHFGGQPCNMSAIREIAKRHQLIVIEDAAHALGAEYHDQRVGTIGDMTCFSFYATKNTTSGEGGALTTDNPEWAEKIAILSLHGISRDAWKRYGTEGYRHWDIIYAGYKYNMFDLQAALALPQLAKIETFWERRRALKARLDAGLSDIPEITLPAELPGMKHAYHLYPIILQTEALSTDRDTIMNSMQRENIGVGIHFRAVHLHPYYTDNHGFRRGMFPAAELYSDRTLSLPFYPKMTDDDADDVITAVKKVLSRCTR